MGTDKLTAWIAVLRDLVCLAGGAWGFSEQITGKPDVIGMTACLALLGGPAVLRAWLSGRTQDTPPSPGSPVSQPSPPPLPSSQPAAGEP